MVQGGKAFGSKKQNLKPKAKSKGKIRKQVKKGKHINNVKQKARKKQNSLRSELQKAMIANIEQEMVNRAFRSENLKIMKPKELPSTTNTNLNKKK
ncbi:hypothetical protein PCE1_003440 [Barthelona sp. PCE]